MKSCRSTSAVFQNPQRDEFETNGMGMEAILFIQRTCKFYYRAKDTSVELEDWFFSPACAYLHSCRVC